MERTPVELRTPTADDVDWITAACQDPEIQRWTRVPRPYRREHAESFVRDGAGDLAVWVVVDVAVGRGVGVVGIHGVDPDTGEADAGYWIAPWGRGRALAAAATQLVLERAAHLPGATALTLRISPGNQASIRTAERAGFVLDRRERGGCHDGDAPTDTLVFRRPLG